MDKHSLTKKFQEMDICAILYWHRSASYFVHTLLDNHTSNLSIFAQELNNFYRKDGFCNFFNKGLKSEELVEKFFDEEYFHQILDINRSIGIIKDHQNFPIIDKEIFREHLVQISQNIDISKSRNFFIAIHLAFELSLGNNISNKKMIIFQLHAPTTLRIDHFYKDFPEAKYIGTYRGGIRGLNSHVAVTQKEMSSELDIIYANKPIIYSQFIEHRLFGWKFVEKRYGLNLFPFNVEDLHREPKKNMLKLSKFLNIEFEDSLLESTVYGIPYYGLKNDTKSLNGFDPKHLMHDGYKKNFNRLDKFVIESLLSYYDEYKAYKNPFRLLAFVLYFLPMKLELLTILDIIKVSKRKDKKGRSRLRRLYLFTVSYCWRSYYLIKYLKNLPLLLKKTKRG